LGIREGRETRPKSCYRGSEGGFGLTGGISDAIIFQERNGFSEGDIIKAKGGIQGAKTENPEEKVPLRQKTSIRGGSGFQPDLSKVSGKNRKKQKKKHPKKSVKKSGIEGHPR